MQSFGNYILYKKGFPRFDPVAGQICNNFEKNRAFYDKSMKLGTWLVDTNTKKGQCHAKNVHLWPPSCFSKMAAYYLAYSLKWHYIFANIMFYPFNFTDIIPMHI